MKADDSGSKIFKRKAYDQLLEWKTKYNGRYAALIEGARRVGKSTIAEEFAKNEYESYIKIDFANPKKEEIEAFDDISDLNRFFLVLQTIKGTVLRERKSIILFDEIQLFPKARQAIKYLVQDGRYDYIETGSLISIRKNVRNILIPSEEHKIKMHPMDFEEFISATCGDSYYDLLRQNFESGKPLGNALRHVMDSFRTYMAVGGMPQAVDCFINTNNFQETDDVKRKIISLYDDDFLKIDSSGTISDLFKSVPSQLFTGKKRFSLSLGKGKPKSEKDASRLFEMINSNVIMPCYDVSDPDISLNQSKMNDKFKLYLADTGLFVTMLFGASDMAQPDIYKKLVSNRISANLGPLYENVIAQTIVANGYELFYHTWRKENSTHSYEIDFLLPSKSKLVAIEAKSSSIRNHESISLFQKKYPKRISERYIVSSADFQTTEDGIKNIPCCFLPFLLERLRALHQ